MDSSSQTVEYLSGSQRREGRECEKRGCEDEACVNKSHKRDVGLCSLEFFCQNACPAKNGMNILYLSLPMVKKEKVFV